MPLAPKGGFTGVDVFFVLSGYLITSVILHDIRSGNFSMREFYLRRMQRLLPNAVVMVFVTVALFPRSSSPVQCGKGRGARALVIVQPVERVHLAKHRRLLG